MVASLEENLKRQVLGIKCVVFVHVTELTISMVSISCDKHKNGWYFYIVGMYRQICYKIVQEIFYMTDVQTF